MTNSTSGLTFQEIQESMTYFDEIAISKVLGHSITAADNSERGSYVVRACVFVHKRRPEGGGLSDEAAKEAAFAMTYKEVEAYFEDDDEIDPDEPETPAGKDDSQPG